MQQQRAARDEFLDVALNEFRKRQSKVALVDQARVVPSATTLEEFVQRDMAHDQKVELQQRLDHAARVAFGARLERIQARERTCKRLIDFCKWCAMAWNNPPWVQLAY